MIIPPISLRESMGDVREQRLRRRRAWQKYVRVYSESGLKAQAGTLFTLFVDLFQNKIIHIRTTCN